MKKAVWMFSKRLKIFMLPRAIGCMRIHHFQIQRVHIIQQNQSSETP